MTTPPRAPDYTQLRESKSRRLRPLRRWLQAKLAGLILRFANRLSFSTAQRLGRHTGRLFHRLARKPRRICESQLRMAFPALSPAALDALVRECFEQMGMTLWEALARRTLYAAPERWIRIEQESVLRDALAEGKGVVLLTGHLGNWELLSVVADMLRIPMHAIVRELANAQLSALLTDLRTTPYFSSIKRGSDASARELLGILRGGEVLVLAIDQDIRANGVFVNFFGIPANTPRVAASLALRRRIPVVTAFGVREPDGRHRFAFQRIEPPPGLTADDAGIAAFTQVFNDVTEAHIRRYPAQWAWHHRRWRRRPPEDGAAGADPRVAP
jgi:KDO2-lipid IV(A) lauroyltransferase